MNDRETVIKLIGELSLTNYILTREVQAKDEEIAKLRAMLEKISGERAN